MKEDKNTVAADEYFDDFPTTENTAKRFMKSKTNKFSMSLRKNTSPVLGLDLKGINPLGINSRIRRNSFDNKARLSLRDQIDSSRYVKNNAFQLRMDESKLFEDL